MERKTIPSHDKWLKKTEMLALENGLHMGYVEAGDSEKETLLLIHGFTDSSRNWRQIMVELEDKYHLLAVDMRGFGKSDKPKEPAYTATELATDMHLFLKAKGIDKAYVVGHSMGTMIAQNLGFQYPEDVLGIVLISGFVHEHNTPASMAKTLEIFGSMDFAKMSDEELCEALEIEKKRIFEEDFLPGYYETLRLIPAHALTAMLCGCDMNDNRVFVQFIKAPVRILWGTEDTMLPMEFQQEMQEYLPEAEFIAYEGKGHEIITEDPIHIAEDIDAFVRECEANKQ